MNWDLPQEAKQALELLGKWRPMDVEDSLELLSSQFTNPTVRRYAVARLQQADDEVVPPLTEDTCLTSRVSCENFSQTNVTCRFASEQVKNVPDRVTFPFCQIF